MSSSIFSSFDVLCAEFLGQKVGFSSKRTTSPTCTDVDVAVKKGAKEAKKAEDGSKRIRLAPEFDGVYCFETIIPC